MSTAETCHIAVLGSTGSIGEQTLAIVRENPGRFVVDALVAGKNIELLRKQIAEVSPRYVAVRDEAAARALRDEYGERLRIGFGRAGAEEAAALPETSVVVAAIIGFEGLYSVLAAVRAGKNVALANKESLVAAGSLLMAEAARSGSTIVPVDSEHSSIYQCLLRRGAIERPRRIILTASGGPFLNLPLGELAEVGPESAIRHPNWSMGAKISVDSATLMNKGLEVIEAAELFQLPAEQVEVLIHPESVVHGIVEFEEGTQVAALFSADMRVPIAYALKSFCSMSESIASGAGFLDLAARETLTFRTPDRERFPALELCYRALRLGGTAPGRLNAANEVAVERFLSGELGFLDIVAVSAAELERYRPEKIESLEDVTRADAEARANASNFTDELRQRAMRSASYQQPPKGKLSLCPGF